jgi:hypothetical protein
MRFDIQTVSEANSRGHWSKQNKRKQAQQRDFHIMWRQHKPLVILPATITFTRYANKVLDSDNLAGAFKACRDQLAREIHIDDGDLRVTWVYAQVQIPKREHYFTVTITPKKGR